MRKKFIEGLATGFYIGRFSKMPGTLGTLWGIPVAWALGQAGPFIYMFGAIVLVFFASLVAELYERGTQSHDPKEVVIDEVVGFVIAMTWLPMTWQAFLAAFLLFRLFDIWKPYPIGAIDQKIEGGMGTVLDDVAAGIVANILLQIVYSQTNLLGVRLVYGGI